MNLVIYQIKKAYSELISRSYRGHRDDTKATRQRLIDSGCQSVKVTGVGAEILWEIKALDKMFMYRYNIPKKEISCVGVRNYAMVKTNNSF